MFLITLYRNENVKIFKQKNMSFCTNTYDFLKFSEDNFL